MTKKRYVSPSIVRHEQGHMNAQAHGQSAEYCDAIDGVSIASLVERFGSPLFVFSEATLRRTCRQALEAFRSRYPDVQFAWSYKTNYLKAICATFHQEGSIAEVVSDFEYDKARALGMRGEDILFNGPYKQPAALQRAVDEGAKIQIDNLEELLALIQISDRKRKTVDVAIRVHVDSGVVPTWSKFGFDADGPEALQAIKRIRLSKHLRLVGLHTHVGTFILDPNVYRTATEKLIALARKAHDEYGFEIRYLNLGGGFASCSRLHYQYLPAESVTPSFDAYAEAICSTIRERWPKGKTLPKLYLETGRALVDDAGYLATTIVALKQTHATGTAADVRSTSARDKSGGRNGSDGGMASYLVDAGIHLLYTAAWYQFDVRPTRPIAGPQTDRQLYGCLCMNIDVIRQAVPLPPMSVGDQLVLHPVGAYNVTQSMQFIQYRPRIVMVRQDGTAEVIREREDLEYVEKMERLPDGLRPERAGPLASVEP